MTHTNTTHTNTSHPNTAHRRGRADDQLDDDGMDDDLLAGALVRAVGALPEQLRALHERLAAAAEADGVLDVAYRTVATPVGELLLAATEVGLVRVAFEREEHDAVLQGLAAAISPRVLHAPRRLDQVARQLEQYFAGERTLFDVALDWRLVGGFRRAVLHALPSIEYGRTASYASVARMAGHPNAVRAVGSACAHNPLPVVVPCHRVIRSDGAMGGYLGGAPAKRTLLDLEVAA